MSSTYNDVKIQLMATGENNTTWGDVTNVNWDAMTELATGSADVSFSSGDVTLTLTNTNATQTARNLRLNLTGTSGGARDLVVPTIEKLYLVNNGLADTVTVKTALGTGIAVPAGKSTWVYVDGTNVVAAVTTLTSLTLASALGVASGGTGLTSGTSGGVPYFSSSSAISSSAALTANQLVIGGGAGAAPASLGSLGTTTTVLHGNAGGAPTFGAVVLTTDVSGTLPVGNGGTGQTSYTDGQLLIGNSSGNTLTKATLTAGSNISITNGGGSITISATGTVTSVTAGTGLSGGTITSSGTISLDVANANNWTAKQTFTGSTSTLAAKLINALEKVTVSATAATGTIAYDVTTQSVLYYTSNAAANWTVNLRGNGSTTLDSLMATGESVTVAFLVTQGGTAYYNSAVQVDGTTSGVTTKWLNGAPTFGTASGVDVYSYVIVKTGSATFTVFASKAPFT